MISQVLFHFPLYPALTDISNSHLHASSRANSWTPRSELSTPHFLLPDLLVSLNKAGEQ